LKRVDLHFKVDDSFPNIDLLASSVKHSVNLIEARGGIPGNMALLFFFYCLDFFESVGVPQIDGTIDRNCDDL